MRESNVNDRHQIRPSPASNREIEARNEMERERQHILNELAARRERRQLANREKALVS
jgi:hypothetical protein